MNDTFVNRLLDNACIHRGNGDIAAIYIQTCCMGWWVRVRLVDDTAPDGTWHVLQMVAGDADSCPFDIEED